MEIESCLLFFENSLSAGEVTVGDRIAASGKKHLWEDRQINSVDVIVIHSISAVAITPDDPFNVAQILKIFCDYGVSSHYLINRNGIIRLLVPEEMKAWHAGGSIMPDPDNRQAVNEFSIGIELMATSSSGFTAPQYSSLTRLCAAIEDRRGKRCTCVGHDQIAGDRAVLLGLRKDAKIDPGPLFDWDGFFKRLDVIRSKFGTISRRWKVF